MPSSRQRSSIASDSWHCSSQLSLGIIPQSKANLLDVARGVKAELARIQPSLPADMGAEINIDFSQFIVESMKNVVMAIGETLLIVLVVIFLFLGSARATLIPAVTIPISLLAGAMVSVLLGYSINTLTLLAVVLLWTWRQRWAPQGRPINAPRQSR